MERHCNKNDDTIDREPTIIRTIFSFVRLSADDSRSWIIAWKIKRKNSTVGRFMECASKSPRSVVDACTRERKIDRSSLRCDRHCENLRTWGAAKEKGFKHATYMAIKRHYIYYYMCICNIKRLRSNERRDEFLRVPLDFPRCRPSAGSISIYLPLFSLLSCFCCFFDRLTFKKLNFTKRWLPRRIVASRRIAAENALRPVSMQARRRTGCPLTNEFFNSRTLYRPQAEHRTVWGNLLHVWIYHIPVSRYRPSFTSGSTGSNTPTARFQIRLIDEHVWSLEDARYR